MIDLIPEENLTITLSHRKERIIRLSIGIALLLFFLFFYKVLYAQCGTEWWDIKTLTDKDAGKINFTPKETTVFDLVSMPKPDKLPKERMESEEQTYSLTAILVGLKLEDDFDFHIVIKDLVKNKTMIIECPDPECTEVQKSSQYEQIKTVRKFFEDNFNPVKKYKLVKGNIKLKVSGVLFFDKIHGQTGVAKNEVKLHPIISVEEVK